MRIGVVFTRIVVAVLTHRLVRRKLFEPSFVIVMQARFIVIDENGCRDVHGIDENHALFDSAFAHGNFDVGRDVDESAPGGDVEPEFFAVGFHNGFFRRNFYNPAVVIRFLVTVHLERLLSPLAQRPSQSRISSKCCVINDSSIPSGA